MKFARTALLSLALSSSFNSAAAMNVAALYARLKAQKAYEKDSIKVKFPYAAQDGRVSFPLILDSGTYLGEEIGVKVEYQDLVDYQKEKINAEPGQYGPILSMIDPEACRPLTIPNITYDSDVVSLLRNVNFEGRVGFFAEGFKPGKLRLEDIVDMEKSGQINFYPDVSFPYDVEGPSLDMQTFSHMASDGQDASYMKERTSTIGMPSTFERFVFETPDKRVYVLHFVGATTLSRLSIAPYEKEKRGVLSSKTEYKVPSRDAAVILQIDGQYLGTREPLNTSSK